MAQWPSSSFFLKLHFWQFTMSYSASATTLSVSRTHQSPFSSKVLPCLFIPFAWSSLLDLGPFASYLLELTIITPWYHSFLLLSGFPGSTCFLILNTIYHYSVEFYVCFVSFCLNSHKFLLFLLLQHRVIRLEIVSTLFLIVNKYLLFTMLYGRKYTLKLLNTIIIWDFFCGD